MSSKLELIVTALKDKGRKFDVEKGESKTAVYWRSRKSKYYLEFDRYGRFEEGRIKSDGETCRLYKTYDAGDKERPSWCFSPSPALFEFMSLASYLGTELHR